MSGRIFSLHHNSYPDKNKAPRMELMDSQDLSCVDFDELGVRPSTWADDNNLDLDNAADAYLSKEKFREFQFMADEKNFTNNETMIDEDDSNYEIDPETGEKIFGEVPIATSPSFSPTNDNWIEEYLTRIESSSKSYQQSISNNSYVSLDESANQMMFSEQYLPEHDKLTPPIYMPLSSKQSQGSLMNPLSISADDEHSISSSSNSSRQQRLPSSFEGDSTTRDSDLTFEETLVEAKLEKIERDELLMPPTFSRRLSTRANYQGQQDEETLHRYNIPLTLYEITQSSTEEYNRHLGRLNYLSPEQIHIIKDIRRRGKNKIAAQNCRKRKAVNVETLLEEVDELKRVKHDLEQRQKYFQQQIIETRSQYEYLHRQVLPDRQLPPAIFVK
ncbi:unnamed protein product [Adineta ricciae]|uniref:BZIP domain-containing protein n=1 Tax=Adineta ricciae TaxID=249248 RepID=A0A815FV25_ADIRI|nr:unnamed protein product [Adineta ricciae]